MFLCHLQMLIVLFKNIFFCVLLWCLKVASTSVVNCFKWFNWYCYMHVMLCANCVQRNRNCWFEFCKDVERCFEINQLFLKQIHCLSSWQVMFFCCNHIHSKSQLFRLRKFIQSECDFNLYNIHFFLRVMSFIQIQSFII